MIDDKFEKYNFNRHIHTYLLEQVKLSDDKAKAVFTISAGILLYLFNREVPVYHSLLLFQYVGEWTIRIISYASMFCLFLSTVFSLVVLYPNLAGAKQGYIFFQAISIFTSPQNYCEALSKLSSAQINDELVKHNFELSLVVTRKYKNLNKSFFLGACGFLLMLLYIRIITL